MKTRKAGIIMLVLVLLVGMISVEAASEAESVADQPWIPQLFKEGEDGVRNLSTAFVGNNEIPILSYSKVGSDRIYQAHKATSAVEGNCGPDNAWYCTYWEDPNLIPSTVSQMATMPIMDTHLIKWAYSTGSMIRGATIELMNDMTFVDQSHEDLIQISKFGDTVIGAPSLQIQGGHYEMAVTIREMAGALTFYKLVHMEYKGNDLKYSCIDSGSIYQCDVIEQSVGIGSMGAPSLQIAKDGEKGIAYYKADAGVRYAYPHETSFLWPSNCGPGGDTWRCISIFAGTETGAVGKVVKLASGQTRTESGIAFTYDDVLIPDTLYHAEYVGRGGNCGLDRTILGTNVYKWQCDDIVGLGELAPTYSPSYSIAIDPEGYSVIALDYAMEEMSPFDLYLLFPKARLGVSDPGWTVQRIDGAPTTTVATGSKAALSLNSAGRGFISYLQEEDYEVPDLKITWQPQSFRIFLPLTIH
jgi:hypothetical protein